MVDAFRILFVDDEETFLFSTADLLRREGYQCDCVSDVAQAYPLLKQADFDLVIADIKMPGNSELEFVRQLAALAEGVPIILVTGYPSIASAVQSIELPVMAYLVKPFNIQDLLAKVELAVRHAGLHRAVRRELARLQEYRQGLVHIETRMQQPPRGSQEQPLQAFVGMTLRNIVDGLTSLHQLAEAAGEQESGVTRSWPAVVPQDLREVLRDTIATLERTKSAFKSKELGELRKRLESLLKG
jgi:DNA-binding NtrC family response regulator